MRFGWPWVARSQTLGLGTTTGETTNLSMRDPVSWQPAETSTAQQRRTQTVLDTASPALQPDVAHSVLIYTPAGGEPAIKTYASEPVNENCFSLFSAAPPKAAAKQRCFSYRFWDDGASFGDSRLTTIQPPLGAAPRLRTSSMPVLCIPIQSCAYSSGFVHSSPPCTLSSGNVLSCAPYFQSCTLIKSCSFGERPPMASSPLCLF